MATIEFEVIGYTSTGMYAELVTAGSSAEALRIAQPKIRRLAAWSPRKVLRWEVRGGSQTVGTKVA